MGAEEYELLVSTLNKLPILKEKLTSKSEENRLKSHALTDLKAEVSSLQKDLETRDSEIGTIDFEMEEIDSQVKKLDLEIADLKDSITIEEKKVEPYIQARTKALKRVNNAKKSWFNDREMRTLALSVLAPILGIIVLKTMYPSSDLFVLIIWGVLCWPFISGLCFSFIPDKPIDSFVTRNAIREKDEVESKLQKASAALHGLKSKIGTKKKKRKSLDYQVRINKTEKERLIGVDRKLKERSQALYDLEKSVSACSKAIESLEKEIEEGQNAIAPLIPYSNLLLDDGSR